MKGAAIGLLIAVGVLASGYTYINHHTEEHRFTYRYDYTVKSGDTLWDISAQHVGSDEDIREYMYNLKGINDSDLSNLKAGQVITLYHY